jgi:hypothetical protein
MIDEGMKKADIGFGKRLLMAPAMPWIRSKMRDTLREVSLRQLVDACCSLRVLGRPCTLETKNALLATLRLPPTMQPPEPPKMLGDSSPR